MRKLQGAVNVIHGGRLADSRRGRESDNPALCPGPHCESCKVFNDGIQEDAVRRGGHRRYSRFSEADGHSLFSLPARAQPRESVHPAYRYAFEIEAAVQAIGVL